MRIGLIRVNHQEVDRLEKLLPPLHTASYAETYAAGPDKRHGCMIVYRDTIFEKIKHTTVIMMTCAYEKQKTNASAKDHLDAPII